MIKENHFMTSKKLSDFAVTKSKERFVDKRFVIYYSSYTVQIL